MVKLFLIVLLCSFTRGENSGTCRVDTNFDNSTSIYCYYLKLGDQNIPLPENVTLNTPISINFMYCTGKINEASFPTLRQMDSMSMTEVKLEEFILPNLPNLNHLQIKMSTLPTLNDALKNIKELTSLVLYHNNFKLDESSFKGLTKLENLDISKHDVTFSKILLKDLKALKILKIDEGKIEKIPSDVFKKNTELTEVYLVRNPIKTIEQGALDPLKKLTTLFLLHTDLDKFNADSVSELVELKTLGIPARSVKDLDVQKLLKFCPNLNLFHFLYQDTDCPELDDLQDKLKKGHRFIGMGYSSGYPGRSC